MLTLPNKHRNKRRNAHPYHHEQEYNARLPKVELQALGEGEAGDLSVLVLGFGVPVMEGAFVCGGGVGGHFGGR
jgi:hypothetical protein